MIKTITKPRKLTYLGVPATVYEYRAAGPDGERVVVTIWHAQAVGQPVEYPAGTYALHHMRGNGVKGTAVTFARHTVTTETEASDWAASKLGG